MTTYSRLFFQAQSSPKSKKLVFNKKLKTLARCIFFSPLSSRSIKVLLRSVVWAIPCSLPIIVGNLRNREVACSASDRQGSNFESCVWRTVSSQSSHHPQEVLLAQFILYAHKGGLKPDSFHFHRLELQKFFQFLCFLCLITDKLAFQHNCHMYLATATHLRNSSPWIR